MPKGATVKYSCEKLRFGQLVSINKTASVDDKKYFYMLMIHEVQVFGFISGMIVPILKTSCKHKYLVIDDARVHIKVPKQYRSDKNEVNQM